MPKVANRRSGGQAIYVILNVGLTSVFQNLVSRCTDAKRHRCEAIIIKNHPLAPCGRGQNFLVNVCELRNLGEGRGRIVGWDKQCVPTNHCYASSHVINLSKAKKVRGIRRFRNKFGMTLIPECFDRIKR